jgi:hypothetical protein
MDVWWRAVWETCTFWSDCLTGRGHLEDLSADETMISNRSYTRWEGVEWINLVEDRDQVHGNMCTVGRISH